MPEGAAIGMRRICVFCGASKGDRIDYSRVAQSVAEALTDRGLDLVYGGGRIGLMGILADAVQERGGGVVGVIPHGLERREMGHDGLTELIVVSGMHERKQKMAELSDAFISLPGGVGTFEETLEILTWAQLGIHRKPCGILNIAGYYDGLIEFLGYAVREGFMLQQTLDLLHIGHSPHEMLEEFLVYRPPDFEEWAEMEGGA